VELAGSSPDVACNLLFYLSSSSWFVHQPRERPPPPRQPQVILARGAPGPAEREYQWRCHLILFTVIPR